MITKFSKYISAMEASKMMMYDKYKYIHCDSMVVVQIDQ